MRIVWYRTRNIFESLDMFIVCRILYYACPFKWPVQRYVYEYSILQYIYGRLTYYRMPDIQYLPSIPYSILMCENGCYIHTVRVC